MRHESLPQTPEQIIYNKNRTRLGDAYAKRFRKKEYSPVEFTLIKLLCRETLMSDETLQRTVDAVAHAQSLSQGIPENKILDPESINELQIRIDRMSGVET